MNWLKSLIYHECQPTYCYKTIDPDGTSHEYPKNGHHDQVYNFTMGKLIKADPTVDIVCYETVDMLLKTNPLYHTHEWYIDEAIPLAKPIKTNYTYIVGKTGNKYVTCNRLGSPRILTREFTALAYCNRHDLMRGKCSFSDKNE